MLLRSKTKNGLKDLRSRHMKKKDKVNYWIESAKYDWVAVTHLLEKGDYSYALFFGHVTVEKLPKAVFVDRFDEPPPFTPEDFKRSGNFIDEIKKTGKVI